MAEAFLAGAFLAGAFLAGAFLAGAFLAGAFLTGAFLTGVFLAGAFLVAAFPFFAGGDESSSSSALADLFPFPFPGIDEHGKVHLNGCTDQINWIHNTSGKFTSPHLLPSPKDKIFFNFMRKFVRLVSFGPLTPRLLQRKTVFFLLQQEKFLPAPTAAAPTVATSSRTAASGFLRASNSLWSSLLMPDPGALFSSLFRTSSSYFYKALSVIQFSDAPVVLTTSGLLVMSGHLIRVH